MENIFPIQEKLVSRKEREHFLNQQAAVFWLTGLSGSGKSTIAQQVERLLFSKGYLVQLLDGDNIRSGLCNNLAFDLADRKENIRRIAELSSLYIQTGIICINAFISPTQEIRQLAKGIIGANDFHQIYVDTSLEICEERDVKGLYKKARAGEIIGFTGIDSPYEKPSNPELTISTQHKSVSENVHELADYILSKICPK